MELFEKQTSEEILLDDEVHNEIEHPDHYCVGQYECIKIIKALELSYLMGSAFAYVWRAGRKGGPEDKKKDLRKAIYYLQEELGQL